MRLRTLAALAVLVVALAGVGAVAVVWGTGGDGGTLSEAWVSDTSRATEYNHHGVGATDDVIVAPILEEASEDGLTRESCSLARLAPADGSVEWRRGVPPDGCFIHSLTKPAIDDVDGDGSPEVVAGTIENETVVLDAGDGSERFAIPTAAYSYAKPTVADLDGARDSERDGDGSDGLEIVASDISGDAFVADANGTVRWRANASGAVYDSPIVTDLDGDGESEVVVASREEIVAFDRAGDEVWRRPVSGNDVEAVETGDGTVVVAVGHDGVVALDGTDGSRTWNDSAPGTPALESIADADGDGTPEAYVSVAGNLVRAYEVPGGDRDWETRLAPADDVVTPPTALADLSGDGESELVAPTNGGTVVVLDPGSGDELAAYERDVRIWTGVTPANVTDSAGEEILVRYGDGRVVALEYET